MRCVSQWQSNSNRVPRNPAQQRAPVTTIACAVAANGTSATPKIGRHCRKIRIAANCAVVRLLLPCRAFARNAAASVWPTIPAPGIAGVVAASRPGWAGQQRTRGRFNGVRQQVASPSGIAGWRSTSEPASWSIVSAPASPALPARPRRARTPQQSVPVIRRGQARAGRQVLDLENGERRDHPSAASPSGSNPHISTGHRQLEHPRLCCDLRCSMIGAQTRVFLSGSRSWRQQRSGCAR